MLQLSQTGGAPATRKAHFADGQLLTAEDLLVEQESNLARQRWLGTAIGTGIVSGLEVEVEGEPSGPDGVTLRVRAGRAIARSGHTVTLPEDLLLQVTPGSAGGGPAATGTGRFGPAVLSDEAAPLQRVRVYLLVAAPALEGEGVALQGDFAPEARSARRPHRFWVETVRCRLVPLAPAAGDGERTTLRNRLAYRCFGFSGSTALIDPGATVSEELYTLIDRRLITDADVPLALLAWAPEGLLFLDQWSVRRRLHPRPALPWPLAGVANYEAISEAMILQFLEQAQHLARTQDCRGMVAAQAFRYLPPVAWLPLEGGFDLDAFLQGLSVAKVEEDPAGLAVWLREAQSAAPVDLNQPVPLAVCAPPGSRYAVLARADLPTVWVRSSQAAAAVLVELHLEEGRPLVPAEIQVYACDARGKAYPAAYAGRRFAIATLPAGSYTVWAVVKGCRPVCRQIAYAGTGTALVELAPRAPQETEAMVAPGNHSGPLEWTEPCFSGYLELKPLQTQSGELPAETAGWTWLEPAQTGLDGWLGRWAAWLMARAPEVPVDPGHIRLLLSPELASGAGQAFALIVFGDGGAYMPAVAVSIRPQAPAEPPLVDPTRGDLLQALGSGEQMAATLLDGPRKGRRRGWLARAWAGLVKWLGGQG
ncbi:MAG TPA: hypothetical protein VNT75_21960 [Symbiobacteriaceae bacterium]|nr:hypothetical protein [Symbiobacteriaceae bacterium]